jgi:hypothetical protein
MRGHRTVGETRACWLHPEKDKWPAVYEPERRLLRVSFVALAMVSGANGLSDGGIG